MSDYMAQKMDDQITGAISENELLHQQVQDLAMTVRMLCHRLNKFQPGSDLVARAMEYQRRNGLTSALREGA